MIREWTRADVVWLQAHGEVHAWPNSACGLLETVCHLQVEPHEVEPTDEGRLCTACVEITREVP